MQPLKFLSSEFHFHEYIEYIHILLSLLNKNNQAVFVIFPNLSYRDATRSSLALAIKVSLKAAQLMHEAVECEFLNDLMVWQMALCSKIWFSLTSFCRTYLQFEVAKNWQTFCKSTRQGSPFEQLQGGGPLTKGKGPMFNSTSFSFNKGGWPHFQLHLQGSKHRVAIHLS